MSLQFSQDPRSRLRLRILFRNRALAGDFHAICSGICLSFGALESRSLSGELLATYLRIPLLDSSAALSTLRHPGVALTLRTPS
eukprot:5860159-Pyramimonas_sp.AAC.1